MVHRMPPNFPTLPYEGLDLWPVHERMMIPEATALIMGQSATRADKIRC